MLENPLQITFDLASFLRFDFCWDFYSFLSSHELSSVIFYFYVLLSINFVYSSLPRQKTNFSHFLMSLYLLKSRWYRDYVPSNDLLPKWIVFIHLGSWRLSDLYILFLSILSTEIRLFQSLHHQDGNLKVRLLIKTCYYIVPYLSTILV